MPISRMTAEENAAVARASEFDDAIAYERGRLFGVRNMIENPEVRKRMEDQWGIAYCKLKFPEVYGKGEWQPVLANIPGFGELPE
jgi:hypothetical protein